MVIVYIILGIIGYLIVGTIVVHIGHKIDPTEELFDPQQKPDIYKGILIWPLMACLGIVFCIGGSIYLLVKYGGPILLKPFTYLLERANEPKPDKFSNQKEQ